MSIKPPICTACVHWDGDSKIPYCLRRKQASRVDALTGAKPQTLNVSCADERSWFNTQLRFGRCGPKGRYFEPKKIVEV